MVQEGDLLPAFSLKDQDGNTVDNETLKGSKAILYFYPKDDTPGCTKEACEFRDLMPKFTGARVFGVSPDSEKSHQKFIQKFDLSFSLLADHEQKLSEALGVWVEKSMYGKKYMGVERTTFLIDEEGRVAKIWRKVKPEGHAEEVLKALG